MLVETQNLVSVRKYAKICGKAENTIYERLHKKQITAVRICYNVFIDIAQYPPEKDKQFDGYIKVKEYAQKYKLAERTVWNLLQHDKIEAIRENGKVFVKDKPRIIKTAQEGVWS